MRRRQFLEVALKTTAAAAMARYVSAQTLPCIDVVRANGGTTSVTMAELSELRAALYGQLLLPEHAGYDEARRLASPRFDKRPALIVQASGAADVSSAVHFARSHGLLLAVKCGGHNDFGISTCDGGMMIDLSRMRSVRVDASARRAWVAGGTLTGQLDHETVPQGLAVPVGGTPTVGIGGLATGGGFGRLSRRFGLTLDAIRSVDVVTADGKLVQASDLQDRDLFWGVRGGGGNFGIVTAFELEVYPIPDRVVTAQLSFSLSQLRQVLRAYGDYFPTAPDELYLACFIAIRSSVNESALELQICYSGEEDQASGIVSTLRKFGRVIKEEILSASFLTVQGGNTHPEPRVKSTWPRKDVYFRGAFIEELHDAIINVLGDLEPHPERLTNVLFLPGGGAIKRVANDATAFAHRAVSHDLITAISWPMGQRSGEHLAYAQEFWERLGKYTRGFYNNDMAGGVTDKAVAANFGDNYPRLARLKAQYDPANLFSLNANIEPTGAAANKRSAFPFTVSTQYRPG